MAQGVAMALEDVLVLAEAGKDGYVKRRRDRIRFVLDQNHRRDRARNLPGFVRAAVFRGFGERIVRANHAKLLDRP
jgi:2-polyprenyl-6-methoxyphenol hydroxylase-like FAD-dependent oxidoreductase